MPDQNDKTNTTAPEQALSQSDLLDILRAAEMEYDAAINAYHEVCGEGESGWHEHNQASYWKGRRDSIRIILLSNIEQSQTANG